jgi:6,7-dimethyl-8-ribityllumazine synthase
MPTIEGQRDAAPFRFAVVVSKYHDFVTSRLQRGAIEALTAAGAGEAAVSVIQVPGAFEIPLAAQHAAASGQFDAVICLGCLIKGETAHFDFIASAVAGGLTAAASATGVPMTFGVLTTASAEEALARAGEGAANKGWEAADAAIAMASIVAQITRQRASR